MDVVSHACATKIEHIDGVPGEEGDIGCCLESVSDVLSSLDLSDRDKTWSTLAHGVGDELGSLSFTLSSQDSGLGLLFTLEDDELGTLGTLLSNLLGLDSAGELARELQVSDRDVVEDDVELQGAFAEDISDLLGHLLSLRDELFSIVLGNGCLEHLVTDGWQDSLVVVGANVIEDLREFALIRSEQDSECDVDCLQILSTRCRWHESWSGTDLELADSLEDRDPKMHSFTVDVRHQTLHGVHLECALATIDNE